MPNILKPLTIFLALSTTSGCATLAQLVQNERATLLQKLGAEEVGPQDNGDYIKCIRGSIKRMVPLYASEGLRREDNYDHDRPIRTIVEKGDDTYCARATQNEEDS
jgi:hypothetical protein